MNSRFISNYTIGYNTGPNYYPNTSTSPGLYYYADPSNFVQSSYNFEYGIRNGDTCSGNNFCSDPLLIGEPAQGSIPPESLLDNFNFHPASGSPAIGAGIAVPGLTTDYFGTHRPNPPSIGAVE